MPAPIVPSPTTPTFTRRSLDESAERNVAEVYPQCEVSLHPLSRLPAPWRKLVDWVVTLAVAIGFVLAFEAEVAKPYRIPSASMEKTFLCAKPSSGCTGSTSDRVLVNRLAYEFGSPQRGQIVVFEAPAKANRCEPGDAGTTFVKRLIGLPGETVREDDSGFIEIRRPGATTWTRLAEPYLSRAARLADRTRLRKDLARTAGRVLHARRQPGRLLRLAHVGSRFRGRASSAP